MSITTLDEALGQLNIEDGADLGELELYVAAANEWIATRVTDTSPTPVKLAALFLIDHWWESQRGPVASPVSDEGVVIDGRGFAIPIRVLEILGPYLLPGVGSKPAAPAFSFPDAVGHPDAVEWPAP